MEPPPHFDLEQAIAAWRQELASHPGPAPDDLRALEAHLRDGFAALQGRQLSDEEAFLIGRHRVGSPAAVAMEYAKATPKRTWATQIFWLAFGLLAAQFWIVMLGIWWLPFMEHRARFFSNPVIAPDIIYGPVLGVPVMFAGLWLARGAPQFLATLLSSRSRVAMISIGMSLIIVFSPLYEHFVPYVSPFDLGDMIDYYLWPLFLLGLMVWLAPSQVKAGNKAATAGRA